MSQGRNGIYGLDNLPFSSREFHKKFTLVSGPLSLFDAQNDPDEGNENPEIERPITPIEDAIKGPPHSFSSFAKIIRPRLTTKEVIPGLSSNDQQELIGVIMNEINNIWGDMKSIPPDPFLSHLENMELQRRLAIEIVTLAQGLFYKFLKKAAKLNQRGVFSGVANMSRLKTQLALEANKSLNVLSIRRSLTIDMKHPCDLSTVSSTRLLISGGKKTYKPLVVRQEEAKLRLTKEELLEQRIQREISDLKSQMPSVKADFYGGIFPEEVLEELKKETPASVLYSDESDSHMDPVIEITKEEACLSEKCISEPGFQYGETLLDELGITEANIDVNKKGFKRSSSVSKVANDVFGKELPSRLSVKEEQKPLDFVSNDLRKLLESRKGGSKSSKLQDNEENDDLPPLLQALAHYNHKKRDKPQDSEDDESYSDAGSVIGSTKASSTALDSSIIDNSITEFTGEQHPQPTVVSLRLPDKSIVRASDVRVSNRVNKSSLVLEKYPTIYNDLTGEIDPVTVKWLDRNLFIGEEIKEVYQEIIRTMNTDFLHFDKDSYVEKCATEVDMSLCNASSSMQKPKKERVMNPGLHRDISPPWGSDTADSWRNNPKFGGLGREDILQAKIGRETEGKSYNSWLAWWRSTINFDDYLKYVSTQDNDFLTVLYHLYDSENDSDEETQDNMSRPTTVQIALTKERERILTDLKAKKTQYATGYWNANSVLLGGLGQDPVVDEDDLWSAIDGMGTMVKEKRSLSQDTHSSGRKSSLSSNKDAEFDRKKLSSLQSKSDSIKDGSPSYQERLERLWTLLCMPNTQRLDMAIKYSAEPHKHHLGDALTAWEEATTSIIDRENMLTKLEEFERNASDPNRFFEKGESGTSMSRIRESRARDSFDKKMVELDREVKRAVTYVKKHFGDDVTFKGRSCLDKLRHDRTEMLYWLQQERRQQAIQRDMVKEVSLTLLELPPLSANTVL